MKRRLAIALLCVFVVALFSGCADLNAATRAKKRVAEIPVAAENLVLYGDKHVTINQTDYSLPSLASKLIKGRKPDLYQNATIYEQESVVYTVVYNRNNKKREEEGCNLALFRFDYQTRKAKLLRDMQGTFPVQSYDMATPSVLQYFDEERGQCVLVRNGALEIVSAQTGALVWSGQVFGAKDYFKENSAPFSFRGSDMVCAFLSETATYYRYTGTAYEVYTFKNEAFKELRAGHFDTIDGALYAVKNDEIVFAADIETGNPRDVEEIAALVEARDAERAALRGLVEQDGTAYRVSSEDDAVTITPDMGAAFTVDAAYLSEHSEEMSTIARIYAEEFPERTLKFSVSYAISAGRLYLSADAEIQGYGLVSLYTPVFVFEMNLAAGEIIWCGMHGGDRLGGVRQL